MDSRTGKVLTRYFKGKLLGKGGFAKCFEVEEQATGQLYAAKIVEKKTLTKPKTQQKLRSEIKIHSSLNHPQVVRFEKYFEDSANVYILLELCTEQTLMELQKRKRRLSEAEAAYLMLQTIEGVKYLHSRNTIHRDLKLGNLLLNEKMEVKIGDFGLAAQLEFDGERKLTVCGTPNYIAPEILDGGKHGHSFEVDVWSLGVIMYTLLVGKPPFETSDVKLTYRKIRNLSYSFPENVEVSPSAKHLIQRILQACPESRPRLCDLENDTWFKVTRAQRTAPPGLFPQGSRPRQPSVPPPIAPPPPTESKDLAKDKNSAGVMGKKVLEQASPSLVTPILAPPLVSTEGRTGREPLRPILNIATAAEVASAAKAISHHRFSSASPRSRHVSPHHNHNGLASASPRTAVTPSTRTHSPMTARLPTTATTPSGGPHSSADRHHYHRRGSADSPAAATSGALERAPHTARERERRRDCLLPPTTSAPALGQPSSSSSAGKAPGTSPKACSLYRTETAPVLPTYAAEVAATAARAVLAEACYADNGNGEALDDEDRRNLTHLQENLSVAVVAAPPCAAPTTATTLPALAAAGLPQLQSWVTDYSDFTAKYGLCYKLCSGQTGAVFNDGTKMVWNDVLDRVEYFARGRDKEEKTVCTTITYPEELKKKVTLITYFKTYFLKYKGKAVTYPIVTANPHTNLTTTSPSDEGVAAAGTPSIPVAVYVKQWLRHSRALVFRLSNRCFQVSFFDGSDVLLCSDAKLGRFTDSRGQVSSFVLQAGGVPQGTELSERLEYIQTILHNVVVQK